MGQHVFLSKVFATRRWVSRTYKPTSHDALAPPTRQHRHARHTRLCRGGTSGRSRAISIPQVNHCLYPRCAQVCGSGQPRAARNRGITSSCKKDDVSPKRSSTDGAPLGRPAPHNRRPGDNAGLSRHGARRRPPKHCNEAAMAIGAESFWSQRVVESAASKRAGRRGREAWYTLHDAKNAPMANARAGHQPDAALPQPAGLVRPGPLSSACEAGNRRPAHHSPPEKTLQLARPKGNEHMIRL